MNIDLILICSIVCLTIFGIARTYYGFKKSISGIALGCAVLMISTLLITIAATQINILKFALALIEHNGSLKDAIALAEPSFVYQFIILILGLLLMVFIFALGLGGIKSYEGQLKSSDLDVKNKETDQFNIATQFWQYALSDLKYLIKNNPVNYEKGKNPYEIEDAVETISWDKLALDLLLSSNEDYDQAKCKWSDSHKCHIIPKNNYAANTVSKTYLFPIINDALSSKQLANINEISTNLHSADQIIVLFEDEKALKNTKTFSTNDAITVQSKLHFIHQSINLDNYAKATIKRHQSTVAMRYTHTDNNGKTDFHELTLAQTFTKARVFTTNDKTNSKARKTHSFDTVLDDWLKQKNAQQLTILGEFGQGKSTLMQEYCARWAQNHLNNNQSENNDIFRGRVPLLIELRARSPKDSVSPAKLLGEWGHQFGLTGNQLYNLVKSEVAVLIFEGFDEVKNAGRKLDRYQHFNNLWQYAFAGSKLIFTGRPNFFFDTQEAQDFLNLKPDFMVDGTKQSTVYNIDFMNTEDITNMLRHVEPSLCNEIIAFAKQDTALMDIAKRPSMLPVIVSQWHDIKQSNNQGEEITASTIIKNYIEATYRRKEENHTQEGHYQLLPWEIRHFITQVLVLDMVNKGQKNTTTAEQIKTITRLAEKQFKTIYMAKDAPTKLNQAIADLERKKGQKDFVYEDYIDAISSDIRSNGLLTLDPATGSQSLYFPHKQFYEFMLGEVYASFYKYPRNTKTEVLSKIHGLKQKNLLVISTVEPMLLEYFAGLFTPEEIEQLQPMSDDLTQSAIVRRIFNWLCIAFMELAIQLSFLYDPNKHAELEEKIKAKVNEPIKEKENIHLLIHIIANISMIVIFLAAAIALLPIMILLKLSALNKIIDRLSPIKSLQIKFTIMKSRCSQKDIDKHFPFPKFNERFNKWHKRTLNSSDDIAE